MADNLSAGQVSLLLQKAVYEGNRTYFSVEGIKMADKDPVSAQELTAYDVGEWRLWEDERPQDG